jgi:hypothetical protein
MSSDNARMAIDMRGGGEVEVPTSHHSRVQCHVPASLLGHQHSARHAHTARTPLDRQATQRVAAPAIAAEAGEAQVVSVGWPAAVLQLNEVVS